MKQLIIVIATALLIIGCAPEVGSKKWCMALEDKPKGEPLILPY